MISRLGCFITTGWGEWEPCKRLLGSVGDLDGLNNVVNTAHTIKFPIHLAVLSIVGICEGNVRSLFGGGRGLASEP